MRQNDEGLMAKYIVHKAKTGETVNNFFVLRPDRDAAAVAAIRAYAAVTENRTLAADLIQWVGPEPNDPLTLEELREMDGEPVWIGGNGLNCWDIFIGFSTDGIACFLRAALPMENCGEDWIPYRRKPEEGTA